MKKYSVEIRWSLIHAAAVLLWTLTERLTGLHDENIGLQQNLSILILLPVIAIYVLAILNKKKSVYHGRMTYVQGFLCGIGLTVGILILTPLVQFLSARVISPNYFPNLIDYAVGEEIFSREQAARQFSFSNYVFTNMVFQMITGVVFSAFIPIWMKSDTAGPQ